MDSHSFILNLVIYLSAAVIAVPLFIRLGLGSVLGYLAAGICIGPFGLKLINNVSDILHFSELGVVLLLFIIGLELEPRKLWKLRRAIVGLGGTQVLVTTGVIFVIAVAVGVGWQGALVAGLGLALSSTAIALQSLKEKNLLGSDAGRSGFAVLLFQDMAVIPIIALISLLGVGTAQSGASPAVVVLSIIGILVVGHFCLRPLLNFVAAINRREIFTAAALLLVAGFAGFMDALGVSMALGAFVAGVLLADSEYRHALESDIEPFKGLLLGLFFISVGMSMDFDILLSSPWAIFAITVALVTLKALILYGLARFAKLPQSQHALFAFTLAQGGEFGFVLFNYAVTTGSMTAELADPLILAVALSMAMTPLLLIINEKLIMPRFFESEDAPEEEIVDENNPVIIIGFGRFGQVIGRLLMANKITPTLIDNNPYQLARIRRFGYKSYYGDALRLDVLRAAGADKAKVIVLSLASQEVINQAIGLLRQEFPHLKIFVRAYDRSHALHLLDNQVHGFARETFSSALDLAKEILVNLGFSKVQSEKLGEKFRNFDIQVMKRQVEVRHDEKALISIARDARTTIEETFAEEHDKGGAKKSR